MSMDSVLVLLTVSLSACGGGTPGDDGGTSPARPTVAGDDANQLTATPVATEEEPVSTIRIGQTAAKPTATSEPTEEVRSDTLRLEASDEVGGFASVSAGALHTCGMRPNGSVECWGANYYFGQAVPPQREFASISSGGTHTCGARTPAE